jgi:hypothetical protein
MNRRYDIDALRVFAFGLLILYHVAMFYVADWGWHVKSAYQAEWLQLPMTVVNQWRMPFESGGYCYRSFSAWPSSWHRSATTRRSRRA